MFCPLHIDAESVSAIVSEVNASGTEDILSSISECLRKHVESGGTGSADFVHILADYFCNEIAMAMHMKYMRAVEAADSEDIDTALTCLQNMVNFLSDGQGILHEAFDRIAKSAHYYAGADKEDDDDKHSGQEEEKE